MYHYCLKQKTHKICHYIFLADANDITQRTRVLSRPHMTNAKLELIKKNQLSNEERLRLSSKIFVINTNYGKLVSFIIILSCLFKMLLKKEGKKT
jgi:dephospho-CoA kinase